MFDRFIHDRARAIDASGIRKVFDLAATLKDPINFSIGQPDFDVPPQVKEAAIAAIRKGMNRYTVTQGVRELNDKVTQLITKEFPHWQPAGKAEKGQGPQTPNPRPQTPAPSPSPFSTLITSGVSGGLVLAMLACVGPGDEVLVPDPYFVMYKHLVKLVGATPVFVDTYPDFQVTAARLEKHITPRTKMILFNSPSNPTGVVATEQTCRDVVALADKHNLLILSDEIYDEFCYEKVSRPDGAMRCPSPAAYSDRILLMRGFSKTYGMTGWRLGYVVGPAPIVEQMTKLQQYTFVCAPSMVQIAGAEALDLDMGSYVEAYRRKRDRLCDALRGSYEITTPGGAFYAFPKVPQHLKLTATQFVERAIAKSLLVIPGNVFSDRDTHFRISYACDDKMLDRGIDVLLALAKG